LNWFEDQLRNRLQNDEDDFSGAFCELSSIIMGEAAAKAGLITPRQKTHNAMQEILRFLGEEITPVPENITDTVEYINYCLKPSGIMKRKVELNGKWWLDASGPMLGILKNGDAVALLPSKKGYVYFDYESGKRVALTRDSAKKIALFGYAFYKPFPSRELSVSDLVKYMFGMVTRRDAGYYLTVLTAVTLMGLIQPRIAFLLYGYIIPQGEINMLFALGALMLSLAIATQILSLGQSLIINRLSLRLSNTVEPAAMMRVLTLPTEFFRKHTAGELSKKLSLIPLICEKIFSAIVGTLLTSLFSIAYFTQIGSLAPALLAPALVIIGAALAINIITTLASIKIQRRYLEAAADLSGLTYSLLSGIQKIKLTGSEKRVFARWASGYKKAANFVFNPPFILKYSTVLSTLTSAVGLAAVYFIAVVSGVTVGEYMAYNTAFGMIAATVLSLGALTTVFAGLRPQMDIVEPILKATPEVSGNKSVVTTLSGGIEINNLTFRYEESGQNILDGLSIKIRPGQYVAIVGKTGCGKSTLVRLLLGFEKPDRGAIYYDGKDVARLDLQSLRRRIGAVMQNAKLFTGDIYTNITISAPQLTMDDAWEAARIAGISEDIEDMPMGMFTLITEGNGGVSGGQKQRLMIARAVAPKPKILIFDESTSALDNVTQKHVADALAKLKCTRIVIAHRLSTIKECDLIYVLDDGKIAEQGTFKELYEKNGIFYKLVNRQMTDQ
jgi:NHLM bacteriocin system ABC transporter ATP-binding protein